MTEKEKQESESIRLEIQARKEVLRKIENAFKRLKRQAESNFEKRKTKVRNAREYKSVEEAQEAWGYDFITYEQFEEIKRIFELGDEYIVNHISAQEAAVKILGRFIDKLLIEIQSFELELLSLEKQEQTKKRKQH